MVFVRLIDEGNDQRRRDRSYYIYLSSDMRGRSAEADTRYDGTFMTLVWQSGIAQHYRWRSGWLEEGSNKRCAFFAMEHRNAELEKPAPEGLWPRVLRACRWIWLSWQWLKAKIAPLWRVPFRCLQYFLQIGSQLRVCLPRAIDSTLLRIDRFRANYDGWQAKGHAYLR